MLRKPGIVNLLKATVNHWSFVTGLAGKLAGKEGGPEDSSVKVSAIWDVEVYEGVKVKKPDLFSHLEEAPYHNVIESALFQCCDFLTWVGGTYDSKTLSEAKFSQSPIEFTIETWECLPENHDNHLYTWQLKRKTHWGGVKWLDAAHTGDGGDRMCAGIATFVCESKEVEEIENGEIATIPAGEKYPTTQLRRVLQKGLAGPKHPESYLG